MSADINITPFTDVVLVLLIVFMVAMPSLYQTNLKVELPQGQSAEEDSSKEVVISIDNSGVIFLDDEQMDLAGLRNAMRTKVTEREGAMQSGQEMFVIVNGDRNVKYDYVVQVMDVLSEVGIKNPGLGIEIKK
jgi:biopolymer transport protein ExbD